MARIRKDELRIMNLTIGVAVGLLLTVHCLLPAISHAEPQVVSATGVAPYTAEMMQWQGMQPSWTL